MNHSGRPRNRRYDYPSQISSSTMPSSGTNSRMPSSYPRITSTGTGLTSSEDMTNYRGRRPPPYAVRSINFLKICLNNFLVLGESYLS